MDGAAGGRGAHLLSGVGLEYVRTLKDAANVRTLEKRGWRKRHG